MLSVIPALGIELAKDGVHDASGSLRWKLALWVLLAIAVTWAWTALVNQAWKEWKASTPDHVLASAIVSGALLVPAFIVTCAVWPLVDVKVCTAGGGQVSGSLIGQTEDWLYLGEQRAKQGPADRRVVSLASATVLETFAGDGAAKPACDKGLAKAG